MSEDDKNFVVTIKNHKAMEHSPKNTLLETIEHNKIKIEYHCRGGYCGACRIKLISGEVKYINDALAFIEDDEILPCCCIPVSDVNLEIP